jgi:GNAT superfamily N-acetyltransferase
MPVVDDPARPGGRLLVGADGAALGRFEAVERDGLKLADLFEPADGIPPEAAAAAVLAEMRGWRIAAHPAFGSLLIDGGGRPRRHSHLMSRDLVRDPAPPAWREPPVPAGFRLTPVDRPALELAPACGAAYPPGHPDFADIPDPDRPEFELEEIVSGRLLGPLLACSGLAIAADGAVAAAILVNGRAGDPPLAGPWISQVFRHPDAPGIGMPLLRRALALATDDGLPALSLAVTHTNPARRVYAELGFAEVLEAQSVEV